MRTGLRHIRRTCLMGLFLLALAPVSGPAAPQQAVVEPETVRLPVVEEDGYRFDRLSTRDGLSQTRVAQILQDDAGFMWFGTQFGLNRFDGYEFKVFINDPRDPGSMSGLFVTALFKDRSGTIWVATPQALDRFDPITESFAHIPLVRDAAGDFPTIVHISQDQDGQLWLATGAGLYRHDPTSGETVRIGLGPDNPDGLSSTDIRWSGQDRAGNFWVGNRAGLDQFDRATGRVILHVPLPDPVQVSFYEDRAGNFWVLNASGEGLSRLDRTTNVITRFSFYPQPRPPAELTGVMSMVEDESGGLWLGSPGIGLLRLDLAQGRFVHVARSANDPTSIPEDRVITLFRDVEGSIWAGHHSVGPSHFDLRPPLFETFRHRDGLSGGLETDFVNAIFEDSTGLLWIGNDFGLTRIDRRTGAMRRFRAGLGEKPMVIDIAEDPDGAIWVGTYGQGLARLDQASGQFTVFAHAPDDPESLCNNQVHRLFFTADGTFWIGTEDGLCRFDPAKQKFATYKVNWTDSRAQAYVSVAQDRDGSLWLGTHYSGLHHFDPATGQFEVFQSGSGSAGGLRDDMVPAVHIDRHGTLWVGTQGGLDRFDRVTGTFTPIYDGRDIPGNTVSRILEDDAGHLWISSNRGLLMFAPVTGEFRTYSDVDGLPGNDLTGWSAAYHSPSGEMFFGGFAGGIAFFPQSLAETSAVPPIVLTDLRFPYLPPEAVADQTGGIAPRLTTHLVLDGNANSFTLGFSALSYVNAPANRYRYRLDGLNETWREVPSTQRTASFTTLPAGTYTFRVQGATARGDWSVPGVVLPITIRPAWWQTAWFRALSVVALIAAIYGGGRLRIAQIASRERAFRKLAENAPDMVLRFDARLVLLYANPAAQAFSGPQIRALGRQSLLDAGAQGLPVRLDSLVQALRSGVPSCEEFSLTHGTETVSVEARAVPEDSGTRGERSVLVIVRDITRGKAAEAALSKSRADLAHVLRVATLDEMAASITHEINQPLTAIITNGEAGLRWLNRSAPEIARVAISLEQIVGEGRRAANVVERIRRMVRKTEPDHQPLDLNMAIREIADLLEHDLAANRVALDVVLDPGIPPIPADRVQLQQVVLNLLKNAIEAMRDADIPERRILLGTSVSGSDAEVTVADTGSGIAAEVSGRLFEAFVTTKPQGLGMGLAISRSIAEAHAGSLRAEATETGGTLFRLTVPLTREI